MLSARKLVQNGGKWIIGDGSSIRIWRDKWLCDGSMITSRSPDNNSEEDECVSRLIDFDRKDWNKQLIFQYFDRHEATKILSTPVSKTSK